MHTPKLRACFLRSAKVARAAVPMADLEKVLELGHGGTGTVEHLLGDTLAAWARTLLGDGVEPAPTDWIKMRHATDKKDVPSLLQQAMAAGADAGAKAAKIDMTFDTTNPATIAWAEQHAASLVTDITTQARLAIRTVVSGAFDAGMPTRETAKLIRSSIGLTERDAGAVMNRQLKLLADGIDAEKATRQAERYADQLLRSRADTIAGNEVRMASNEGQRALWDQAIDKGLLTEEAQKGLIQVDPCPICLEVSDEVVPVAEEFSIGLPPFHVNCECEEGLV